MNGQYNPSGPGVDHADQLWREHNEAIEAAALQSLASPSNPLGRPTSPLEEAMERISRVAEACFSLSERLDHNANALFGVTDKAVSGAIVGAETRNLGSSAPVSGQFEQMGARLALLEKSVAAVEEAAKRNCWAA